MNLISIIVPVYNGEKYLPSLLQCFSNQTYKNFEVVFVDDFSTDCSYSILEKAAKDDKRFIVVKRPIKGGTAVKGQEYGLQFCKGEYYFFLSQDDFIDNDLLEKCIKKSIDTNADVVMPNMVLYYEGKQNVKSLDYPLDNDYSSELTPKEAFELSLDWRVHGFVLRKMNLVKRIGIRADYYNSCEYFLRKSFLDANKIVFANTNFYYRQDNSNAITKSVHWFSVDILTTDLMALELGINNHISRDVIKGRINQIEGLLFFWLSYAKNHEFMSIPFEHQQYVLFAIRNAILKLIILEKNYFGIFRAIKFLKKIYKKSTKF